MYEYREKEIELNRFIQDVLRNLGLILYKQKQEINLATSIPTNFA